MGLTPEQIDEWAAVLSTARHHRTTRDPLSASIDLSLTDAYAIQQRVTAARLARGERIVGWKLGYTSLAMREQMGVHEPNFGPLTDAMLLGSGDTVSRQLMQPRVEPEIGMRFGRPLAGRVTIDEVMAAVDECVACLEVVDSVYIDYRFRLEDNTADGSSAAQVVVGPRLGATALDALPVELVHNGRRVATATGAAASGHPAAGVVWLVARLAEQGLQLEAGQLVITGGLTAAVPLMPGDTVGGHFGGHFGDGDGGADSSATVTVTVSRS